MVLFECFHYSSIVCLQILTILHLWYAQVTVLQFQFWWYKNVHGGANYWLRSLFQRVWWIFTPSQIRGGLIYYPGAAVDGRAYFPLAFEIAARGHMVVIVQLPLRNAGINFADANVVLNSNISAFSGM
jgi:hypothetical protein